MPDCPKSASHIFRPVAQRKALKTFTKTFMENFCEFDSQNLHNRKKNRYFALSFCGSSLKAAKNDALGRDMRLRWRPQELV